MDQRIKALRLKYRCKSLTRDQLSRMDQQALKHEAQNFGVLARVYGRVDSGEQFRNAAIEEILKRVGSENQSRDQGIQRAENLSRAQQSYIADLPQYTERDLISDYKDAKIKGDGFRLRALTTEFQRRGIRLP